jgi:transposase
MEIPDHSLPQITPEVLGKLNLDELLKLSVKLLKDLKESRDRLNQNSNNSSRPSGSIPPWEKDNYSKTNADECNESEATELEEAQAEEKNKKSNQNDSSNEVNFSHLITSITALKESSSENRNTEESIPKKPGKQKGSPGYGRTWNPGVTEEAIHCSLDACVVCSHSLDPLNKALYTQYNQVDIQLGNALQPGLTVIVTPYLLYDNICANCGHQNRYDPKSHFVIDKTQLSEWRWVGPYLASLIVHLKMDFRLPIRKIQGLLNYFGIRLSAGVIQQCYEESGVAVAPLANPILETLIQESLIHADETVWLEKSKMLWLWIFNAMTVVYFCVGRRTKEQLQQILNASFSGWLMADGYGAYRHYEKRLRCWAHLLRKAQGLADSMDLTAAEFGRLTLDVLKICMNAIYDWRKESYPSEKTDVLTNKLNSVLEEFKVMCEKYGGVWHEKTKALAREFLNDWDAIFRILQHPYLPLTNNEAECGLRPWVLLRKICFGSKSSKGTKTFTLLASVIGTCRKRAVNSVQFLADTIFAARKGLPIDMIPNAL